MTVHKFFSEMSSYPADCWTGNLTEAFKILKRFEDINYQQFLHYLIQNCTDTL